MSEMDDREIAETLRAAFAEQSAEGFTSMEEALLHLERNPFDSESLRTIFRVCHTLKGDSQSLGYQALAEVAHALEDLLAAIRSGDMEVDQELVNLLLDALDVSRKLATEAMEGRESPSPERESLLARIRVRIQAIGAGPNVQRVEPLLGESSAPVATAAAPTLRVRVELLDRLLDLVGEIAIGREGFAESLASDSRPSISALLESHQELDSLVSELQQAVMTLRLVPIAPLFRQQQRVIRDTAILMGKQVRLHVEGDDAELDTTIVEHLRDPLSHMIRNAIAHGIESAEERVAAGKDPEGRISLSAVREGATIVVQARDDGRGLDRDRIRARAVSMGLVEASQALDDAELFELIFEPGFSTSEQTGRISGRGVGMDVVRRNVEEVGGVVSVSSEAGVGTEFRIELPLTVAIIDALGVGVGTEHYVIPLSAVVECLQLPRSARRSAARGVLALRGRPLPFMRLSKLLGSPESESSREHVVVIQHRGRRAGIAVDALHGECQAVVKPLDPRFRDSPGIAGTTIRSDGSVALILDAPALLRSVAGWHPEGDRALHSGGSAARSVNGMTA